MKDASFFNIFNDAGKALKLQRRANSEIEKMINFVKLKKCRNCTNLLEKMCFKIGQENFSDYFGIFVNN